MEKQITLTEFQIRFFIKLLKNHKKLRKSHFVEINSGLKKEKFSEELVMVNGLIEYLELVND